MKFRSKPIRAALFLVVIVVVIILGVYLKSFVSEETDTPKEGIIPVSDEPTEKDYVYFKSGLREIFKSDFPNYLTANRKVGIRILPDSSKPEEKQDYELEFRLHCDFKSLTKFISVYLPSTIFPNAIPICKVIAKQINEIINLVSKGDIVAGSRYGDRKTEIDDLKFSGIVHVYHDAFLSEDEKDELRLFYKQKNLDPKFLGAVQGFFLRELQRKGTSKDK